MIARGLTVREAAARLRIGKTALYAALRDAQACEPGEAAAMEGT
jgi:hypothetical protein